jgi:hypothetical protein
LGFLKNSRLKEVQCYFIPDRCVPEEKVLDVSSLGQCISWSTRPLDDASVRRRRVPSRYVPALWDRLTLCWDRSGWTVAAKPGIIYWFESVWVNTNLTQTGLLRQVPRCLDGSQGAAPPPPVTAAKAGRNHLNEQNTPPPSPLA